MLYLKTFIKYILHIIIIQRRLFNMQVNLHENITVKPFLKWAGGKKQLLNEIESHLPDSIKISGKIDSYFEPFVGGGAVFFHLYGMYKINKAYLSDINPELILVYNVIKKAPVSLIDELNKLSNEYKSHNGSKDKMKSCYYGVRNDFNNNLSTFDFDYSYEDINSEHIERAAQMIFLNKTCFNGLFRVNKNGEFNVPCAYSKNPLICDYKNIINVSKVLQNVNIKVADYNESKKYIDENSFIYLDPPYKPLDGTSNFNGYYGVFNDKNQVELSNFYKKLDNLGAKVLLSNSNPKIENSDKYYFDDLYGEFNINLVDAKRFINSKGNKRGPVKEILVSNY